ncbi:MAG TPA: GNAT family N-acetyltransferase [Armatimonadota bacterium]|jgi:hypothetical protein
MKIIRYHDARAFYQTVEPLLLEWEAENNLMLGIASRLADGSEKWSDIPPRFYSVEEEGRVIAAALQTPPHKLILTRTAPMIADLLAGYLQDEVSSLPGVLGPAETVDYFVKAWGGRTGRSAERETLRLYRLDQVAALPDISGRSEVAGEKDFNLLLRWKSAFLTQVHETSGDLEDALYRQIARKQIYLWKDPGAVSMASFSGPTPHGIRIGGVYTPRKHRNHGYATANVAALSQRLLDSGYQFCYLFTNLENPTSNAIYQQIGYQPICNYLSCRFIYQDPLKQRQWVYGTKRRKRVSE